MGSYYALVIGNNNYQNLPKLQTAENDATAVAQLLHDRYGFQTQLLTNATRAAIMTALAEYRRQLTENANLVIYYAGHGFNDKDAGEAYWLPVDAQKDNNEYWISADDITRDVRAISARHVLIISDSCYSGGLTRDADADINLGERSTYLTKMLRSKSRTLMSSGGNEPVSDEGANNHSVFAWALLQAMNDMEEDEFTADDLFHRKVRQRVGGQSQQLPEYKTIRNSGHVAGDFVFFRSKNNASKNTVVKDTKSGEAVPVHSDNSLIAAKRCYQLKQYDQALQLFRASAQAGNAEAARHLANMYMNGQGGLAKDDLQAVTWYRKAAEGGDPHGMANLGLMYRFGRGGLPQDDTQAVTWYRKAADAGNPRGMVDLGFMYESGRGGLPQDYTQAVTWFRKAADLGDELGMRNLGSMYETGRGLPKDDAQALSWYRKAAALGDEAAKEALGRLKGKK